MPNAPARVGSGLFLSAALFLSAISTTSATRAAPPAPAAKPLTRTAKQIQDDLVAVEQQIKSSANYPVTMVFDPAFHEQMSREFPPLITRREALTKELATQSPQFVAKTRFAILKDDTELSYFGDDEATHRVQARLKSTDPADATDGQLSQAMQVWWKAKDKPNDQAKVLDLIEKLAKAQPRNDDIAESLMLMLHTNPATVPIGQRANDLICKTLKSAPVAGTYMGAPNKIDEPLVISGTTFKGPTFSTDKWKGKVVLVDFWATWCPPCREALPALVKLYTENHDRGLEVLGVSSDNDRATLAAFLKEQPAIVWPQLFTANGSGAWHPLTKRFGIDSIPRVYLIDRAGNLRSIDSFGKGEEEWVRKLLDEPAPAGAAK
jgi:thiol-disulfide isomerase/thioredoxin